MSKFDAPDWGAPQVIEFTDIEEAFDFMRANEEAANASVTDDQKKIVGDCFVKRQVQYGDGYLLTIYGEVWSMETFTESEKKYLNLDDPDEKEEFDMIISSQKDTYERGYRFGKWYSVVEPDGELGSAHIVSLDLIEEAEFNAAKERGWS